MKTENEMCEKKEVVLTQGNSPAEMIRMAVSGNADLDKLEKLLNIQERWEANEARKAYHDAMSKFKANPPKIDKNKSVNFGSGKAAFKHATLANVCEKISAELSKYGLSASWKVSQNGSVAVTCIITHEKGHSEETTLTAQPDSSGSKNSIQAIGSTITYLERYTLLALTGLATEDHDDDGASAAVQYIDEQQHSTIIDLMNDRGVDEAKFLKHMKIESIEKMPKSKFQQAVEAIKSKKKAGETNANA